jgi:putative colanic acid biosynthesis acetyltransferase WcaF
MIHWLALPTSFTDVDLSLTSNGSYRPGRSFAVRSLWLIVEAMIFLNPLVTSYRLKRRLLKVFGSDVGVGLIIKPNVHIKYPWRLIVGNNVWLGERCWIDNMENVTLEESVCVSQGAYLCTGNHDWSDPGMKLSPRPIVIESGAWIGAFVRVAPGIRVGRETVLTLGSILQEDAAPRSIYSGSPATQVGTRRLRTDSVYPE